MGKNALMIIDPQNDFCDQRGSLYVEGAAADMSRLARRIKRGAEAYSDVFVSLDSHDSLAIFHPKFWVDGSGVNPRPFTAISPEDYASGAWRAASRDNEPHAEKLFRVYSEKKIDALMIWPEHCIVSTWGQEVADSVREALRAWRETSGKAVRFVFKGENPYTEQFSVFEGVDGSWGDTAFNELLFGRLAECDSVTFAGEALSHCVEASIASYLDRLEMDGREQEIFLIADCSSPVSGFERALSEGRLASRGVRLVQSE
ncbi:MAG: isochorismatase family protein [Synergistaceae bacterium]|nr:isochorismatase family protein [Synergistaceae bacterium]